MLVSAEIYYLLRFAIGLVFFVAVYLVVQKVPVPDWAKQVVFIILGACFVMWLLLFLMHFPNPI